ncbi:MAG: hypothetical protein JO339_26665 [Alphaproteobacteria bacterium]|nr:hypothetical protein [Alphaproteobacteria bacterium]
MTEDAKTTDLATAAMATIVITVDHVYLPLAADGTARAEWKDVEETTRVAKRTRLKVPADLALELSKRDQAEIL